MKLVDFENRNIVIAKDQKEYLPIPAYRHPDDKMGRTVFCWRLSLIERIKVLLTGNIWQQVLTFREPLQPQLITTEKPLTPPTFDKEPMP